jgi:hypothetical protein
MTESEDVPPPRGYRHPPLVLPHYRGEILEVRTNSIRLLWGVCGAPSGAWCVVRSICDSHNVHVRTKWDELKGSSNRLRSRYLGAMRSL